MRRTIRPAVAALFSLEHPPPARIYTLSLHDALPISGAVDVIIGTHRLVSEDVRFKDLGLVIIDRKSTRLNSSHITISYAVFCLKKKKGRARRSRAADNSKHIARTPGSLPGGAFSSEP